MTNDPDPQAPRTSTPKTEEVQSQPAERQDSAKDEKSPSRAGALGFAAIILGNIATFTGAIEQVNEQVQKLQEQLHLGETPYLLYVLIAVIFAGYLLASTSVYKHLKEKIGSRLPGKSITVGAFVFLATGALVVANVSAIPPAGRTILRAHREIWASKIRQTQQDSGGFSVMVPVGLDRHDQAFATAQGLTAVLTAMNWDKVDQDESRIIRSAFDYIDSQREPIEEGWCYFGQSCSPLTEIAGWVTVARIKALEHGDQVWPSESDRNKQLAHVDKDLAHIASHYVPGESAWSPYTPNIAAVQMCTPAVPTPKSATDLRNRLTLNASLKGLTDDQSTTRTYSTVMALWALIQAHRAAVVRDRVAHKYDTMVRTGIGWMLTKYSKERGSWLPNPHRAYQREDYPGLTGQALYVLYEATAEPDFSGAVDQPPWNDARHAFLGKKLKEHLFGDNSHLSDMDAYVFPFPQPLEPMTFLWAPWSLVANRYLSADSHLSPSDRKLAMANISTISANYQPQIIEAIESGPTYQLAENLFCMSEAFR